MTLSLCLVCAAIAPLRVAVAQERIVVVRAAPAQRSDADALGLALVDALVARGERASLPAAPPPEPDEREALEAAERDYQMLRPELAAERLEAALARVDERGSGLPRDGLIRAWLLLAMARAAAGDEPGADRSVSRALAIDPELAPDPAHYPPPLRDRVERLRSEIELTPLVIEARPAGAAIEIDGAPSERDARVAPGTHVVRARAPRRRPAGRAVEVGAGGAEVTLALELDPLGVLADPGLPGEDDAPIASAARLLDAEAVIVDVRPHAGALALEARQGERVARTELALGAAPGEVARAAAALVAGLHAPAGEPLDPVPWIVAGSALAVGAAVAVAIGVAVSGGTPAGFDARGEVIR